MSGESIGWGAQMWLDSAADVLTQLMGVFELTVPNDQADDIEVTHYGSVGRKREYIAGLIETGEGTVSMNYVPGSATDILIRAAHADAVVRDYKIVIPDPLGAPEWNITGKCYVKGYERGIPLDDRMTAVMTIKFTGDVTEAAA